MKKSYRGNPETLYDRYMMFKAEIENGDEPVPSNDPRIRTWWDFTPKRKKRKQRK